MIRGVNPPVQILNHQFNVKDAGVQCNEVMNVMKE